MLAKFLLNTYGHVKAEDGLSIVYHRIKLIAPNIDDANELPEKSLILVAGIPHLYIDRLSPIHVNICFTTYEFEPIPDLWVEALNACYTAVVVPHESIKSMFLSSGVLIPIYVVAQGFTRFPKLDKPVKQTDDFILGFLGVPVKRKNLHLIIEAIEKIGIHHRIKLKVHVSAYYAWFEEKAFAKSLKEHPLIVYSDGYKSVEDLANWYQDLDAYIFPSSGEGWSFTPRESLSLGIPTIISKIPVHEDLEQFCCILNDQITAEGIKEAILLLMDNFDVYQEKAKKGQEWISTKNEDDQVRQAISKILDKYAAFEY